ncbi:25557_t:CDS:1, partial [Gigaspora rosea]
KTSTIQHKIFIDSSSSIKQRFYFASKPEHEFIGAEIQHMEKTGIL